MFRVDCRATVNFECAIGFGECGFAAVLAGRLRLSVCSLQCWRLRRAEAEPQTIKLTGKPEAFRKVSGKAAGPLHTIHEIRTN